MNQVIVAISVAIFASSVLGGDCHICCSHSHAHTCDTNIRCFFLQMGVTRTVEMYMIQSTAIVKFREENLDPQLVTTVMKATSCMETILHDIAKETDTGLA